MSLRVGFNGKKIIQSRYFANSANSNLKRAYQAEISKLRKTWFEEYKEKENEKKLQRIELRKAEIQRSAINLRKKTQESAIRQEIARQKTENTRKAFQEKLILSKILRDKKDFDQQKRFDMLVKDLLHEQKAWITKENIDKLICPELFQTPCTTGLFTSTSEYWRWSMLPVDPTLEFEEGRHPVSFPGNEGDGLEAKLMKKAQKRSQMFLEQMSEMESMVGSGEERDSFRQHLTDFTRLMDQEDWACEENVFDEFGQPVREIWHTQEEIEERDEKERERRGYNQQGRVEAIPVDDDEDVLEEEAGPELSDEELERKQRLLGLLSSNKSSSSLPSPDPHTIIDKFEREVEGGDYDEQLKQSMREEIRLMREKVERGGSADGPEIVETQIPPPPPPPPPQSLAPHLQRSQMNRRKSVWDEEDIDDLEGMEAEATNAVSPENRVYLDEEEDETVKKPASAAAAAPKKKSPSVKAKGGKNEKDKGPKNKKGAKK